MPQNNPENWGWVAWATGFIMSAIGGAIGYYLKMKKQKKSFVFVEFLIESSINFFIAFSVFMVLYASGVTFYIAAPLCSLVAHNATRYLFLFDNILTNKIKSIAKANNNDDTSI